MVSNYDGDGEIVNISWRLGPIPISGFSIHFEEFDLSQPLSKTYNIQNLPDTDEISLILAFEDPRRIYDSDSKKSKLVAGINIKVFDVDNNTLMDFEGKLKSMTWQFPFGRDGSVSHGLYDVSQTINKAIDTHRAERIVIEYSPDSSLKEHKGRLYITWGGSI